MKLQPTNRSLDKFRAGLMYVGIITVVTVVIWISVGIYTSYSKPEIDPSIQAIIKPINPNLDNQVLIDYSNSRLRPAEQFQILSIVKEGNQTDQVLLDPYSIASPEPITFEPYTLPETASISAETSTASAEIFPSEN